VLPVAPLRVADEKQILAFESEEDDQTLVVEELIERRGRHQRRFRLGFPDRVLQPAARDFRIAARRLGSRAKLDERLVRVAAAALVGPPSVEWREALCCLAGRRTGEILADALLQIHQLHQIDIVD
jgi:hypothetical protein